MNSDNHNHDQMPLLPHAARDFAPYGTVDLRLLQRLICASVDQCQPCREQSLLRVGDLPATVAKLVALTGAYLNDDEIGRMPTQLTDEDAPGITSPAFRQVFSHVTGHPGYEQRVFAAVKAQPRRIRRIIAEDALRVLTEHATTAVLKATGGNIPDTHGDSATHLDTRRYNTLSEFIRECRDEALAHFNSTGSAGKAMAMLIASIAQGPDAFSTAALQKVRTKLTGQRFDTAHDFRVFLESLP